MQDVYDFGALLQELREYVHLSQNDVAKLLGISKQSVYLYENNEVDPSFSTVKKMAGIYNSSLDYIAGIDKQNSINLDDFPPDVKRYLICFIGALRQSLGLAQQQNDDS